MRRCVLVSVIGSLLIVACGGDDDSADVTVFAASSLTEAFTEIGDAFEAEHPGTAVTFSFGASSALATQISEGAAADVFASADPATMGRVADDAAVFATNRPVIVVEPGNPLGIEDVDDLADPDVLVVVCAIEVPCGAYAHEIFARAGVDVRPSSYETNVKSVVTKIRLGEADAGIAYATDVIAADGEISGVELPDDLDIAAEYPIVALANADPEGGASFVDFVRAPTAQEILLRHGFGTP
jgi:molybdate transport system substrate-binding protein